MLYDEHYPTGLPGPVASQAWYDESAIRALTLIPRDKAIFAIGTYGYHWDDTGDKRPAEELAAQPWAGCVLQLRVETPGLPANFARLI